MTAAFVEAGGRLDEVVGDIGVALIDRVLEVAVDRHLPVPTSQA